MVLFAVSSEAKGDMPPQFDKLLALNYTVDITDIGAAEPEPSAPKAADVEELVSVQKVRDPVLDSPRVFQARKSRTRTPRLQRAAMANYDQKF